MSDLLSALNAPAQSKPQTLPAMLKQHQPRFKAIAPRDVDVTGLIISEQPNRTEQIGTAFGVFGTNEHEHTPLGVFGVVRPPFARCPGFAEFII